MTRAAFSIAIVAWGFVFAGRPGMTTLAQEVKPAQNAQAPTPVSSQVEGVVTILELAPDGSSIGAGDVIATLDSSGLRHSLAEQQIKLKQAELTLQVTRRSVQIATLDAKHTEALLQRENLRLDQLVAKTKADLQATGVQVKYMQGLLEKQMTGPANVEFAHRRRLEAENSHTNALNEKKILSEFNQSLQNLKQQVAIENAADDESFQQAVVELERSRLAHLEDQIEKCLIKAPTEGILRYANPVVGERKIDTGLAVHERQVLVRIEPIISPAPRP